MHACGRAFTCAHALGYMWRPLYNSLVSPSFIFPWLLGI